MIDIDEKIIFVIMSNSLYDLQKTIESYRFSKKELIVLIDNKLTISELDYLKDILKDRIAKQLTCITWKECISTSIAEILNRTISKRYLLNLRKCNKTNIEIICNDYELLDNEIYNVLGEF